MVVGRGHKLGDWMCLEEQTRRLWQRHPLNGLGLLANAGKYSQLLRLNFVIKRRCFLFLAGV